MAILYLVMVLFMMYSNFYVVWLSALKFLPYLLYFLIYETYMVSNICDCDNLGSSVSTSAIN